jgi:catechol 2,3-dioxygenase-like lactoylglutathione lyase family enzyme
MTPFASPHHICIVVDDLERALALYERAGIGPWRPLGSFADLVELEGIEPDALGRMTFMCADTGGLQLQLVQPGPDDTPHWRFLQEHGPGVFSLSFSAAPLDDAEAEARSAGLELFLRGRRADRTGFSYFDTRAVAGVALQLREPPRAG